MSIDNFKKLIPYFKNVKRVALEGWGESLLRKDIIEIIRLVKAERTEVGFVTSGKVLNKDHTTELINTGLDFVGFSLFSSKNCKWLIMATKRKKPFRAI